VGAIARAIIPPGASRERIEAYCSRLCQGHSGMHQRPGFLARGVNIPGQVYVAPNLFAGLSAAFENTVFMNRGGVDEDVRYELHKFVELHFPHVIEVEDFV
jgi:hypothetical protein